jgi:hypothetical protein
MAQTSRRTSNSRSGKSRWLASASAAVSVIVGGAAAISVPAAPALAASVPPPASSQMVQRPSGETDIAAVNSGHQLRFLWNFQRHPNWSNEPVSTAAFGSAPALVQRVGGKTPGEMDIAAITSTGQLRYHWNFQGHPAWGSELVANGPFTGTPAMILRPSGETDIAAITKSGQLRFFWNFQNSHVWNGETVTTGAFAGSPSLVQRPSGESDIAVVVDGKLKFFWNFQGHPNWDSDLVANGPFAGSPVLVQRVGGPTPGEMDIAAITGGGQLRYYRNFQGHPNWSNESVALGTFAGTPAMVLRPSGEIDIAAFTRNGQLRFLWNFQFSRAWENEFVVFAGSTSLAMVQRPSGETDIAAVIGSRLWFWWNFQGSHKWTGEVAASGFSIL